MNGSEWTERDVRTAAELVCEAYDTGDSGRLFGAVCAMKAVLTLSAASPDPHAQPDAAASERGA